jgi:hypothetical protein
VKTGRKEILQQRQVSPALFEEKPFIGLAGVKPVQEARHVFSSFQRPQFTFCVFVNLSMPENKRNLPGPMKIP